jgi:PAS domain S-box-containing protein
MSIPDVLINLNRELKPHGMDVDMKMVSLEGVGQKPEVPSHYYRDIYDLAPIGYLTMDKKHVIRQINTVGSQLFGAQRESLLGNPFLLWIEKESQDIYRELHKRVFETGESRRCQLKLLKEEGCSFHASIEFRALSDIKGNVSHFLAAVNDISERIAEEMKLQEMSIALKVLVKQIEEDKIEMGKRIVFNLRKSVMPYLEQLKHTRLGEDQLQYLQLIQANIENVISPFLENVLIRYDDLTRREVEIVNLVKDGHISKEIASLLCISTRSVEFHKDNIRKKMGLTNKKIDLYSYLTSLQKASVQIGVTDANQASILPIIDTSSANSTMPLKPSKKNLKEKRDRLTSIRLSF